MIDFIPKAYFSDLDGTLLDLPKKPEKISKENLEIALRMNDEGKPFILATGRYPSEFVLDLAKKINSKYVICQNGGLIVDNNGNVLIKHEIKKDEVMSIIEILKQKKLFFIFNSGDTIYGTAAKLRFFRPWVKHLVQKTYSEIPQITNSTKIITFGTSKRGIRKLVNQLEEKFKTISLHIVSRGYAIEINSINATKGKAIDYVSRLLDIDPKQTVHFGDSGNDTSVIPYVGAFVAMKNSLKNIKIQSKWVAGSYKKYGVAKAIKLIEKI
ncbi:HAD family hydrolase [Mycoplasma enhydrae]|uniref:HAD family hydrolase n=1 Tax=Mycoplasma enhydrae TaxID=2499220 RepID=UPI00197BEF6F|nr:HAD family hydrolase [Mycoplasma enhydrae]MBN4089653.1 HAD family hydrolase [Mycoplasma enhydrae]MCV3733753.1 HAD family hydrolase [Mycoplasma enhydrae]MCV3753508.1 HAD family hydrolase [Mycoplasma enhydrae]